MRLSEGAAIEVKLRTAARGLIIRYAVPVSFRGPERGYSVLIDINGHRVATVPLSTRFVTPYAQYWANGTGSGVLAPRFWDEARLLLPRTAPAGAYVSLRAGSGAAGLAIDLVEAEQVGAAAPSPRGAMSVLRFGADPAGHRSSRTSFERAIAEARKRRKFLYVPPGRYRIDGHLIVDRVRIVGAGHWYSVIFGHSTGIYSRTQGSAEVRLSGLAIESDVTRRNDHLQRAAIGGIYSRSTFNNLYLHHANVGVWLDGPAHDLVVRDVRITDMAADGINLHRGISHAVIANNLIRNSGDDGIASWSEGIENSDIAIRGNRVISPRLANGIALYGGSGIEVSGNWIADTITEGGGIHLGARFRSEPFSGRIRIVNNWVMRSGSMDPHWHFGVGSIWIYALERSIAADILIAGNRVDHPACEAIQLLGPERIERVAVDGLDIVGPVTSVLSLQAPGWMSAARVVAGDPPLQRAVEVPGGFRLIRGEGNRGWIAMFTPRPTPPQCS